MDSYGAAMRFRKDEGIQSVMKSLIISQQGIKHTPKDRVHNVRLMKTKVVAISHAHKIGINSAVNVNVQEVSVINLGSNLILQEPLAVAKEQIVMAAAEGPEVRTVPCWRGYLREITKVRRRGKNPHYNGKTSNWSKVVFYRTLMRIRLTNIKNSSQLYSALQGTNASSLIDLLVSLTIFTTE